MGYLVELAWEDARTVTGTGCPKARYELDDVSFEIYLTAFEQALNEQALRGR